MAWQLCRARGLAQNELTLTEILKMAGHATGAVVGGPWLKRIFGLGKGFDYYDDAQISTVRGRLARQVTSRALGWLKESQEKEFFLFLNYFDPHSPYSAPEGFGKTFLPKDTNLNLSTGERPSVEENIAIYDAEILYMDYYIGRFLRELKARNLYDRTLIIVTADHGELLGEHDAFYHGHYLYQEEIHVPLLLKYPGLEVSPNRTDVQVQLNDIFAIILERQGIGLPPDIQAGVPPQIGHPVLTETYPLEVLSEDGHWRAIFEGDLKFIWSSKGNHLFFHLGDDPGESVSLAAERPQQAAHLLSKMNQYLAKLPKPGPTLPVQQLDESTKKTLKSLGYVD
jgi:arylsulfatase A-like enzyme